MTFPNPIHPFLIARLSQECRFSPCAHIHIQFLQHRFKSFESHPNISFIFRDAAAREQVFLDFKLRLKEQNHLRIRTRQSYHRIQNFPQRNKRRITDNNIIWHTIRGKMTNIRLFIRIHSCIITEALIQLISAHVNRIDMTCAHLQKHLRKSSRRRPNIQARGSGNE